MTVTMNRPERKNAANGTMWRELLAVFDDVAADRDARAMVLTGAGGAFCSGADLSDPSDVAGRPGRPPPGPDAGARPMWPSALHRIPKPTIAKVGGVAAGAGMSMALGCDLVVASESARFSQIFAKRGLSVDFGASWLLPRLIGLHRAKELAFFADILSARRGRGVRPGQPGGARRRARRVRRRLGPPPRRGSDAGAVDDQVHAQQLAGRLHGPGARGRGPGPGGQFRHPGHPGGADAPSPSVGHRTSRAARPTTGVLTLPRYGTVGRWRNRGRRHPDRCTPSSARSSTRSRPG